MTLLPRAAAIRCRPSLAAACGRLAVAALALFHLGLLGRRLAEGGPFDLEVALRWLGAAAVGGLYLLAQRWARRSGFRDRRAELVLGSLVLLLHGGGMPLTPAGDLLQQLPLAEIGTLALPFALAGWTARFAPPRPAPVPRGPQRAPLAHDDVFPAVFFRHFPLACRPPPLLAGFR